MDRWWIYQQERFPIIANGLLIAAFSLSAICFSQLLRHDITLPGGRTVLVAFFNCFLFFLLLRIADEFKDFEDDSRYRPYRPVPRGLVALHELARIAYAALLLQLLLGVWLQKNLLIPLVMTWTYLFLMRFEFFVPEWLKRHPLLYMGSHMLIMPLIDFFATACDWLNAGLTLPPAGMYWFLLVSFFNGIVIEIGRKIRAPQDEETGVETYSALWGTKKAVRAWLAVLLLTAACAYGAAAQTGLAQQTAVVLCLLLLVCGVSAWRFLQHEHSINAKRIETFSGIWTLVMYLSLGVIPLSLRIVGIS